MWVQLTHWVFTIYQGTKHSMRTGTCHLQQQQHLRVMTHINFCLHRNQHNTNKHVDTSTTSTHRKQKCGKQPVESSTNKRDTNAYCTVHGLPPSKDESIPKGSIDTEHDMTNIILHLPHTGPVSNHMTPSPTVNRGHSQGMTGVESIHTPYKIKRWEHTAVSAEDGYTHTCFVQITCERFRTYVHAHLKQMKKSIIGALPPTPSRQQ